MNELEDLIRRVEREKAAMGSPPFIDALLYLLRQQRLVPPVDAVARTQVGPGPATNSLVT